MQPGTIMLILCLLFICMSVLTGLQQVQLKIGNEVNGTIPITCSTSDMQPVKFQWYKYDNNDWSLYKDGDILKEKVSGNGRFFCLASDGSSSIQSAAVYLTNFSLPSVNVSQKNNSKTTTLICTAKCNPEATEYVWFLNNKQYKRQPGEVLKFWNIQESDKGSYTCKATNQQGTGVSPSFVLKVPPELEDRLSSPKSDNPANILPVIIGLVLIVASVAIFIAACAWWRKKAILLKRKDSTTRMLMKTMDEEKEDGEKGIYATVEGTVSSEADKGKGVYAKLDATAKESDYDAIKGTNSDGGEGKGVYTGLTGQSSQSDYQVLKQKDESNL
ncbi:hemicentin-1-like [Protopterus annectens]|uniref:hemicentin-1-like n=1 Tax=Protopterus annectens TaxID=7888 RepID=UPI001CFC3701|nr:hemicentin-1-like [Protopterus annectens]XP_043936469.1 hemicentin-1-like [Protopterus annectens]XP_043936470.1 hemicentin-1-like [Protopterus annectens]